MQIRLEKLLCTCFGLGYAPAPGTVTSAVTCVGIFLCGGVNTLFLILFIFFSLRVIQRYLKSFEGLRVDPPHVVLDEVAGQMCSFVGVPISLQNLFLGFFLFRFFDIVKPGPIKSVERLSGAHGVLWDDVVAGFVTMLILKIWSSYV